MDLQDRLKQLENVRDWQGLVEELEKGIQSQSANEAKASFHLRLGQVLEQKFLAGVKALKHFQDAYKLNPALAESLEAARAVYWALGKLNMVQKLLELELRTHKDGPQATRAAPRARRRALRSRRLRQGDEHVRACARDERRPERRCARVPRGRAGRERLVADARRAARCSAAQRRERRRRAEPPAPARGAHRASLRAGRGARGCSSAPTPPTRASKQAAALFEGSMGEAGKLDELEQVQSKLLAGRGATRSRARSSRSRLRHALGLASPERRHGREVPRGGDQARSRERGRVPLPARRLRAKGRRLGSRPHARRRGGHARRRERQRDVPPRAGGHDRVASARQPDPRAHGLRAPQPDRAASTRCSARSRRRSASALERAARRRQHPADGATPPAAATPQTAPPPQDVDAARRRPIADRSRAAVDAPPPASRASAAPPPRPSTSVARRRRPRPAPAPAPRAAAPTAPPPATRQDRRAPRARRQAGGEQALQRVRQDAPPARDDASPTPTEKVELYTKAAELYTGKFANQAEAVKAYEAVLAIDPENRERDRLPAPDVREASRLGEAPRSRAARGRALLDGDERAREVPRDREARHRARQEARGLHRALARGRSRTIRRTPRRSARSAASTSARRTSTARRASSRSRSRSRTTRAEGCRSSRKLGTLYGDRLNNDEGAVDAWRALLAIDPNDRKAQEALKKKYLALGRWDDLEVFYAESGKWDEFIRVLEQQEAKETDDRGQDRPALQDRRALGGHRSRRRSRGARLREGPRARRRRTSAPPRRSSRSTRRRQRARALANAIEVKLGHDEDAYAKLDALPRGRRPLRGQGQGAAEGVRALPRRRSSSSPRTSSRRDDVERAREGAPAQWDERHRRVPKAIDAGRRRAATRRSRSRSACGSVACSSTR